MKALQLVADHQSKAGQYEDAVESLLQAIQLKQFKLKSSLTVDHYLSIARIYDKQLSNPTRAHHFYNQAYEAAMELVSLGFPLSGSRKSAIEEFIVFKDNKAISKQKYKAAIHQNILEKKPETTSKKATNPFKNTHGKSFNEIVRHYKYNVLAWAQKNSNNTPLHKFLGMSFPNKNVLTAKLKKAGFEIPDLRTKGAAFPSQYVDPDFQSYIESLKTSNWHELNARFDKDLINYYYKKNNNVVRKTAEELKLNQLTIRKRIGKIRKP
ncbi:MAG: tetratricopeptide repeat protein [FCB group bacterium]|nr:tetratricopeptide repeat protein [FCB group bacterium]